MDIEIDREEKICYKVKGNHLQGVEMMTHSTTLQSPCPKTVIVISSTVR